MKYRTKRRLQLIIEYCFGWVLAFIFLSIVRGWGTTEVGVAQFDLKTSKIISIIFGLFFGCISGLAQIYLEERVYRRIPLYSLLLYRFLYALLFLVIIILVSYIMVTTIFGISVGLLEFVFEPGSFAIYIYIITVDVFQVILRQVNLMLGEKNLRKQLLGKFYTPREEERIFMFLDLQSSTQLAERLGHIKYSMLIQDCFNDLGVVAENEAEIYQYVGDEVILTWELNEGLRNQNCLNAFFDFKKRLAKKEDYYQKEYGELPFFKAGMNAGVITVTEVGRYKKEIAYHGDTINTASRIQAKCNDYDSEFLVSAYLKDKLDPAGFDFNLIGSIALKGKEKEVEVYSVKTNAILS